MPSKSLILVLMLILALAAGCAKGPDDAAIANDIKAKMYSDQDLKAANLDVSVKGGEVTLTGEVASAEVQLKAYKVAETAPGVQKVQDHMKVAAAQAPVQQAMAPAAAESPKTETAPPPEVRKPAPVRSFQPPPPPRKKAVDEDQDRGRSVEQAPPPQAQEPPPPAPTLPPAPSPRSENPEPSRNYRNENDPGAGRPASPRAPQPVQVEIPSGTQISVRMLDSVDSSKNQEGDVFRSTLDSPITREGQEIVPVGTEVVMKLTRAESAGRMTGRSELHLELVNLVFQGQTYQLDSSTYEAVGKSRGKDTATKVGIGAGIGAAIGAIVGGGKGAAIGAGVGAGGGTAVQVATRGQSVRIPSETLLNFTLQAPVSITYTPGKGRQRQN